MLCTDIIFKVLLTRLPLLLFSSEKWLQKNSTGIINMLDIFCDKIDPNTQCYGAGAGGAESFCVPGAGAEIIFLIKIYCSQSGSC